MQSIPDNLFYNSGLTSITIPSSVTKIGYRAFGSCANLETITIPKLVSDIPIDAFSNCTGLKTVIFSGSIKTIGNNAFYGCENLKSISLPDSITDIYADAFGKCGFETFTFPKNVKEISGGVLYGCSNLKKVILPAEVTRIYGGAFWDCTSLTSFDIPATISEIEEYTFYRCTSLTSIGIPSSVTSIGNYAFSGCTSLSSIGIPASVTSIGDRAFSDCTKLRTISLPASIKTIGDAAFSGCTGMTEITLEKGITKIGEEAFGGCVLLSDLFFEGNETEWNSIDLGAGWDEDTSPDFKAHCRCAVTFDANGHGTAPAALKNIWSNYTITQPSELTAEGYTFTGWYKDKNGYTEWDFSKDCPTGDTVIYAGWQKNEQAEEEPEADPIEEQEEEESKDPVDINEAVITKIPDQAYTGKAIQPAFTVTYGGKTLVEGTDFYVSWRDNKKIGKATLIIAGMDDFEGAKQTTFKIIPQSVKLSSLKAGKKSLTVKWKKGSKIDGYEIQYSLKSNFKSAKKITITGASTKKVEIEGLKKKKTYYVRIRTFKKVGSKKYYSEWSEVKSKKTK